ncbi:histidine triad (HIT) protein [Kipferlia bialata]|uniref:Histidine triad (HIT) protein n=1 Tax=Kipferlia bialata TaxID=797122 RepID=A0A391P8G8_9EUKA|nr:histidine triad (HIT) protein [Kipferlia bialata]|eukprot:g13152.t1
MTKLMTQVSNIASCIGGDYNVLVNNGKGSGQEVPHIHVHIIPSSAEHKLSFAFKHSIGTDHGALATQAQTLREKVEAMTQ